MEHCSLNSLPFAHLNLRKNPFGEFSIDERVQIAFVDPESILSHIAKREPDGRGAVVQILGDKGFGKTTHLLSLAARLEGSEYVYLPEDEYVRLPSAGEPLLVDEAQRLTLWQRLRLFSSPRTLIMGTHRDFTNHLRRAGRRVLNLQADQHTTPQRVSEILNARIQAVRRSHDPVPFITMETVERMYAQFGHDLRSLQYSLYDIFQQLECVRDV